MSALMSPAAAAARHRAACATATWASAVAHLSAQLAAGEALDRDHAHRVTQHLAAGRRGSFLRWWLLLRSEAVPQSIAEATALRQRGLWRQALLTAQVMPPTGISGGVVYRNVALEAIAALTHAGRWEAALGCLEAAGRSVSAAHAAAATAAAVRAVGQHRPAPPPPPPPEEAARLPPECPEAAAVALTRAPTWQHCLRGCGASLAFLAGPSRHLVESLMLQTACREGQWVIALAYVDAARRTSFTPAVCCIAAELAIDRLRDPSRAMLYLNVLVRRHGAAAVPDRVTQRLARLVGRPDADVARGIERFAERIRVAPPRRSEPGLGKKAARRGGAHSREQVELGAASQAEAASMATEVLRAAVAPAPRRGPAPADVP